MIKTSQPSKYNFPKLDTITIEHNLSQIPSVFLQPAIDPSIEKFRTAGQTYSIICSELSKKLKYSWTADDHDRLAVALDKHICMAKLHLEKQGVKVTFGPTTKEGRQESLRISPIRFIENNQLSHELNCFAFKEWELRRNKCLYMPSILESEGIGAHYDSDQKQILISHDDAYYAIVSDQLYHEGSHSVRYYLRTLGQISLFYGEIMAPHDNISIETYSDFLSLDELPAHWDALKKQVVLFQSELNKIDKNQNTLEQSAKNILKRLEEIQNISSEIRNILKGMAQANSFNTKISTIPGLNYSSVEILQGVLTNPETNISLCLDIALKDDIPDPLLQDSILIQKRDGLLEIVEALDDFSTLWLTDLDCWGNTTDVADRISSYLQRLDYSPELIQKYLHCDNLISQGSNWKFNSDN